MPILGWPGPLDEGKNSIGDPDETNAVPQVHGELKSASGLSTRKNLSDYATYRDLTGFVIKSAP